MHLRKRVKKQDDQHETESEVGEVETSGEGRDAGATATPSKTKRSGTTVVRRRRKGKLAQLLEMPIEIFTEVACYMTPGDLLNLARTSIGLRTLLMSKSSIRVWEAARTLQDIPDCPPDLSEPQYADLLFGKGCSFCSETRTRKAHTAMRVRVCKTCAQEKLVEANVIFKETNYWPPSSVTIHEMIPYALIREARYGGYVRKFMKSKLAELFNKVKDLSLDADGLKAFVEEGEKSTEAMRKFNADIDSWIIDVSERKEELNDELINARRTSILKRLRELGYGDDDLDERHDENGWKWRQLLRQTRPLSERVWQNVKPQLEATIKLRRKHASAKFLADRRSDRWDELVRRFTDSRDQLFDVPFGALLLRREFVELPAVKEFLRENEYRFPMSKERWHLLLTSKNFRKAVATHAKVIEADCMKMIKDINAKLFDASEKIDHRTENSDTHNSQTPELDEDCIPSSLLAATSLFKKAYYSAPLESYAELLQTISKESARTGSVWAMNAYNPSAPYSDSKNRGNVWYPRTKTLITHKIFHI